MHTQFLAPFLTFGCIGSAAISERLKADSRFRYIVISENILKVKKITGWQFMGTL